MRQALADVGAWGSPLVEVERAVQERAKTLAIDMVRPEGRSALRALVAEEIRRWADDVKAGSRPTSWPTRRRLPNGPGGTWPATARSSRPWPTPTSGRS